MCICWCFVENRGFACQKIDSCGCQMGAKGGENARLGKCGRANRAAILRAVRAAIVACLPVSGAFCGQTSRVAACDRRLLTAYNGHLAAIIQPIELLDW